MRKIFLLIVILTATYSDAQTTKKVCFLGNSYTYVNDLPGLVGNLASAAGNTLVKDQNTPGGYTLAGHSTNVISLTKIAANTWDYVVLQDQSQMPSFPYAQTSVDVFPKAKILSDSIRAANVCAIPLFYNTWGREIGDSQWDSINTFEKMNNRLYIAYDQMVEDNNGKLAPVGIGFRHVSDAMSTVLSHSDLYAADGSHPSIHGSYLAACFFYYSIFDDSPLGNTYHPSGMTALEASYLQNVVHHVVFSVDSLNLDYSNSLPQANFTATPINLASNFTNTSVNGNTYLWDFGDGNTSTDFEPNYTYATTGNYLVTLIAYNCSKSDTTEITVNVIGIETDGISEYLSHPFQIYPNPSTSKVFIKTEFIEESILIYNYQGQKIFEFKPTNYTIEVELEQGVYFVKIGSKVQKIIILD